MTIFPAPIRERQYFLRERHYFLGNFVERHDLLGNFVAATEFPGDQKNCDTGVTIDSIARTWIGNAIEIVFGID